MVKRFAAAVCVVALVAVACGSDDSDALSKEDFVEQANAICTATNDDLEPLFDEFFTTTFADIDDDAQFTPEEQQMVADAFEAFSDEVLTPAIEAQIAELRALGAPEDDADLLADLLDDVDKALAEQAALIEAAAAGDPDGLEFLDNGDDPFSDVDQRAIEYGLTACGED
jgi:hypothetical protein